MQKPKILEQKVLHEFSLRIHICKFSSIIIEVKIMNIPKIAISNEDDPNMKIVEIRTPQIPTNSSSPSPYKSIIKNRLSQPRTSSSTSTTTQSYHTAPTRQESYLSNDTTSKSSVKNKSTEQLPFKPAMIDENDTENDVSDLSQVENTSKITQTVDDEAIPRRRGTISTTSVLNSNENLPRRQYSLRQNRSSTSTNNGTMSPTTSYNSARNYFIPHVSTPPPPLPYAAKGIRDSLTQINQEKRRNQSNPIRRTNSYRACSSSNTLRRFIVRDGKLIEQETNSIHPVIKRRSTLDYSSYPMTQIESSSIYLTPKYDNIEQDNSTKIDDSIRLMTKTSSSSDQRDIQADMTNSNYPSTGVSFQRRFCPPDERLCDFRFFVHV